MVALLRLLALVLLAAPAAAEPAIVPGDLRLRVEVEDRDHPPYVGEMVLIRIRGTYKIPITLESLEQPPLDGFGWMQLGPDKWFAAQERGQKTVELERVMALFPERPGTLTVAPFTHDLTLSEPDGTRFEYDLTSEPVEIEVLEAPEPPDTWLPVRGIEVSDRWSNAPEALGPGAAALRVVAVTVLGVQPETMTPMPEMTGVGAVILPHPEKRLTELRPSGPVTRVFWRWSIRPDRGRSGYVDPLTFSYYDTQAREPRSITLSAQKVAYAGTDLPLGERPGTEMTRPETMASGSAAYALALLPVAPVAGFLGGRAILLGSARFASPDTLRRRWYGLAGTPDERALRRAIRADDAARARRHARRIVQADIAQGRYPRIAAENAYAPVFAPIDAALYGTAPAIPVREFGKAFRDTRRGLRRGPPNSPNR